MRPLLLAAALLLTVPSVASATIYRGKTSQGKRATLTTDGKDRANRATVAWKANCDEGGTLKDDTVIRFGSDGTRVQDDYPLSDSGGFKIRVKFTYDVERLSQEIWSGTFRATGTVRLKGTIVDRCQLSKVTFDLR